MAKMTNAEYIKKMRSLKALSGTTAWEALARLEAADKRIAELEKIVCETLPVFKAKHDFTRGEQLEKIMEASK